MNWLLYALTMFVLSAASSYLRKFDRSRLLTATVMGLGVGLSAWLLIPLAAPVSVLFGVVFFLSEYAAIPAWNLFFKKKL